MKNIGTIVGLVCGFIIAGTTATMGVIDMKEQLKEAKAEVKIYEELNDRQQDIILKYKQVSGIEVSSITQSVDNEQLINELEKRINDLEDK